MNYLQQKPTTLVVDDNNSILEIVKLILTGQGYTTLIASNAQTALTIAETYEGKIDMLLTDIMMPGMNGPELAFTFKNRFPAAQIVFMSGSVDIKEAIKEYEERYGETEYLLKPFSSNELTGKLNDLLDYNFLAA